jgi:hypothetical protein
MYNLGDGEQDLELSGPPASDGQWHTVNAKRILQQMTLKMDGGEGRNYNFSRGNPYGKVNLNIQRLIFAGSSVSYSQQIPVLTGDLVNSKCSLLFFLHFFHVKFFRTHAYANLV